MVKTITLKFDGKCATCGAELKTGERARWSGRGRVHGIGCHESAATGADSVGPWPGQRHERPVAPSTAPPAIGPRLGAAAAIIAELERDKSESMSDYCATETLTKVVLAWSRHTKDLFPEMRAAAATFEPTAFLATGPASFEHREKWSMGAGYYLKASGRYSDGWKVRKITWDLDALDKLAQAQGAPVPAPVTEVPLAHGWTGLADLGTFDGDAR